MRRASGTARRVYVRRGKNPNAGDWRVWLAIQSDSFRQWCQIQLEGKKALTPDWFEG